MHEGAPKQPQAQHNQQGVITGFEGMEAPQNPAPTVESGPQEVIQSFDSLPQPTQERPASDSSVVVASDRAHTVGRTEAPAGKPFIDTSWLDKK